MTTAALATHRIAPGPRGDSLIQKLSILKRNLSELQRNPFQLFLGLQREFGGVARLRLGPYVTHLVTHPDFVKYVLADNHRNYSRGKMYENFKLFFGNGLLTTDGEVWREHRRIVQPLFHRRSVEATATTMTDTTAAMLTRWQGHVQRRVPFDIVPEMMHLSLSILGQVMFSSELGEVAASVGPAVRVSVRAMIFTGTIDELIPLWIPTPYNQRIRQAQHTLRQVMHWIIEAHRNGHHNLGDLVSLLLAARNEETGEGLSDVEILDELMTIFLAGHETTGTALAWTLYVLAKHPDVRRKLEHELDSVLGDRTPTVEDLRRLPYLRMVIDEALRLYPPIWLYPRDTIEADEIGGYYIPARSSVFLSPYVTHRDPEFWENPDAFDPERFIPERAAHRPRFAYFPFGGGQRQCIGNHMALLQLQFAVAMIAQRYHLHLVPGHPIECGTLVSLRPLHGILMTLHPRSAERQF